MQTIFVKGQRPSACGLCLLVCAAVFTLAFSSGEVLAAATGALPLRPPRAAAPIEPSHGDPFAPPPQLATPRSSEQGPSPFEEQVSLTLPLSFLPAADALQVLKEQVKGRLSADPFGNALLFRGSEEEGERLRRLLKAMDKAGRQITLEAKLLAVSLDDTASVGVNWAWDNIPRRGERNYNDANDSDSSLDYDGNFKFYRGYAFRFQATLNALIAKGKAKILATPRLVALPGRQASIFIGDHIPVQTEKHDSSGTYTSTDYIDAGIKLQYTPIVSSDGGLVTAAVHTEVSTPTLVSEIKNYKVTSRTADTWVRLKNGETLIIGGLIGQ